MKVVVVSNCATAGYHAAVCALFPDWEVKAAGLVEAAQWLETGEKPHFSQYLQECDLYIGAPLDGHPIASALRPDADRIFIPGLYFRGLHPDIVQVEGFWGPFSQDRPHTQTSLIVLGAGALGLSAPETEALFCEDVFERLSYHNLYDTDRHRLIADFAASGVDIDEAFEAWDRQGDFFHITHHPRGFVLVDVIRYALKDKYLSPAAFSASHDLGARLPDTLAWSEAWPVYPGIARRHGFAGGLTWLRNKAIQPREMPLREVVEYIFGGLGRTQGDWKAIPFIAECARLLRP